MREFLRDERKALAAILAGALAVRIIAALTILVISHDGARFTGMARYFADGRWDAGLDVWPRMSPLFPILILGFGSGAAVSAVLGTLAILPVYAMTRSIWDRRVATIAALLLAFLPDPITYGGSVMSEAPFCFFFYLAMEFVRRAAEQARWGDWIAAGVAGGLAALTRPEGGYVAAAIVGWAAIRALRLGGWPRRMAGAALAVAVFCVVVFPYAKWIHEKTGRWSISDSPFSSMLAERLGLAEPVKGAMGPLEGMRVEGLEYEEDLYIARFGTVGGNAAQYVAQVIRLCGYVFFPFLLAGFFRLRNRPGDWFVVLGGAGYLLPPLLALLLKMPFSHRYMMPGVLFWVPIIALGLVWVGERAARYVPEPRRLAVGAAALALVLSVSVVKALRPDNQKRRTLIDAGRWIAANSGPRPVLATMDRRVEHYAEGYSFILPATFADLEKSVQERRVGWVVLLTRYLYKHEDGFREKIEAAWPLAHVIEKSESRGGEVRIYCTGR